ncbi:MAG: nucleotidyl transferase AbiEii/AbiGii toxin family protein [Anaerolineaceae bacterium]|nr:nucleotidyl transferase AbiEii/AbiGii toxin family protein [Anaerolineaceae bacterium]
MISEAEIRRVAAQKEIDPMIIDLDYSLGWLLLGLTNTSKWSQSCVFKGGTCLRKCYFPDYRFSEDLDFTMIYFVTPDDLGEWITQSAEWVADQQGPNFLSQPNRLEIVNDDYGNETYQARVYFRGSLRWGGPPRAIKLDVTRAEIVTLPAVEKPIIHPYSDGNLFEGNHISCYSLEEIVAEKMRAIAGQRRFAVSRDIYDIYQILTLGVDMDRVYEVLPQKFIAKELDSRQFDVRLLEKRRIEYERDWNNRLNYLIIQNKVDFEEAWQLILNLFKQLS